MPQTLHEKCTVADCDRAHKTRGYCATHYQQFRRGVPLTPIKARDRTPHECCSEEGCREPVKAKGLCKMHYARLLRHGFTKRRDRTKALKGCKIPGCENYLYCHGLCSQHYERARKTAKYGLTMDDYTRKLEAQRFVCEICERPERAVDGVTGKLRDLVIDHCHERNVFRGILCSGCNRAIGLFNDDPDVLRRAAEYIDRFNKSQ